MFRSASAVSADALICIGGALLLLLIIFKKNVLEMLRQPLEEGTITLAEDNQCAAE